MTDNLDALRDTVAQLAAEVAILKAEVAQLQGRTIFLHGAVQQLREAHTVKVPATLDARLADGESL